jgi:hypothetical protein
MVIQKKFSYSAKIGNYFIEDGIIKNSNDNEVSKQSDRRERIISDYDPGDDKALFKKLVAVDHTSEKSILAFYHQNGSLQPFMIDLGTKELNGNEDQTEYINSARRAIFYFKTVFKLDCAIIEKDHAGVRQLIDDLFTFSRANKSNDQYKSVEDFIWSDYSNGEFTCSPYEGFEQVIDDNLIKYAKFIASGIINTHLKNVRPFFKYLNGDRSGYWKVNCGLSAIYFEYYLALCKNIVFRMCQNKTCSNPVEIYGVDKRKQFCSNRCANTESKRRVREQRKRVK